LTLGAYLGRYSPALQFGLDHGPYPLDELLVSDLARHGRQITLVHTAASTGPHQC
jgi:hypothetical protein